MRLTAILLLLFWCLCSTLGVYAQEPIVAEYRGQVLDAKSMEPISNAIVLLLYADNSSTGKQERIAFGSTDSEGRYSITVSKKRPNLLEVRLMGYKSQRVRIDSAERATLIYLEEDAEELPEVVVLGAPITSKGDTIRYRAGAFITNNTYSAEDLMKRLPGLSVDTRGTISYLGEPVQGVYIEGLDLVADNYQTATRIIKAEDISAVEVIERFQKKKVLKEIQEGERAMINIRLKNNTMLTPSGEVVLGGGVLGADELVHSLGANLLLVNKSTQIIRAGIWDRSTVQESAPIGSSKSIPNSSARGLVGNALTSHSDKSKSLSQMEVLGTLNQIFVLKDDVTAKYNVGYVHKGTLSKKGNEGFLADGDGFIHFTDEYTDHIASNLAGIALNYTENSDQKFLLNTLTIEGDWEQGAHNIIRGEAIVEQAKSKEFRLQNNFELVTKNGDDVTSIQGKVNYRKLPGIISFVPSGRYQYYQKIYGSDLSAYTRASYGWGLGGLYSLWGTIEFEGHLQDMGLTNEREEKDRSVNGGKLLVGSSPTISYNASKLKWSLSVPLQFNFLSYHYQDLASNPQKIRRGKLGAGLSAKVGYRPSPLWYLSWNGRYGRSNLSEMTNYILGSYHSSFDQIVSKSDIIEPERSTLSSFLNIEYRQPLRALFGRLTISTMRTEDNKIVSRTLEGTAKMSSQTEGTQIRDYIGGELYLSKQIPALKSLISISTDYGHTSYPIIIGGQLNPISAHSFGAKVHLNSTPLKWMEVSTSISRRGSLSKSSFGAYSLGEWDVSGRLVCSFLERWSAGISGSHTAINGDSSTDNQSYTLLGVNVTYRHKRFRFDLRGDNLLNMQALYRVSSIDADRYSSYFALRPRQIMLSSYIKF